MGHKKAQIVAIIVTLLFIIVGCKHRTTRGTTTDSFPPQPVKISAPGIDAAEPAIAPAGDGSIYVVWVNHDAKQADVMLARFNEAGQLQGSPVRVNKQTGAATAWRGDQPSVAVAPDGAVHVLWTARVDAGENHGTDVYLSSSTDRGQSFATEVKVNDDKAPGPHGMHSLAVAGDGRIYAVWLDERNVHAPKPSTKGEGHHMESNRDVYLAYSTDGGRSFSANKKVASEACPCCKTALTVSSDGTLYAGWRQVLPGSFRHIAVAGSTDGGKNFSSPVIVSDDRWVLQGCPVSGPSLSVDRASGNLKVVWYAAGEGTAAGVYFAESKDKGQSFTPRQLLSQETVRGTPALAGPIALWQTSETAETKMRSVSDAGYAVRLAANAELPAGIYVNGKLFVAYIGQEKEKRSIWLIRAALYPSA
jgi:hypothetical protein